MFRVSNPTRSRPGCFSLGRIVCDAISGIKTTDDDDRLCDDFEENKYDDDDDERY